MTMQQLQIIITVSPTFDQRGNMVRLQLIAVSEQQFAMSTSAPLPFE